MAVFSVSVAALRWFLLPTILSVTKAELRYADCYPQLASEASIKGYLKYLLLSIFLSTDIYFAEKPLHK
jgi:hypothetical protein